jgi:hypothetical protein
MSRSEFAEIRQLVKDALFKICGECPLMTVDDVKDHGDDVCPRCPLYKALWERGQ